MEKEKGIVDKSVDNVKNSLQFRRDFHGRIPQNREQIMNIPVNNQSRRNVMGTRAVMPEQSAAKIP